MKTNQAYPKRRLIHYPLVMEIHKRGGKSKPIDLYDVLADHFDLDEELRNRKVDGESDLKWHNIVRWARQDLVDKGIIINGSERGVWELCPDALSSFQDIEEERAASGDTIESIFTQAQLDELLKTKKKIGQIGEDIVVQFEKKQLSNIGLNKYANEVRSISKENCCTGYDIVSFFEDGSEKYIEVKSSSTNQMDFYISLNELNKAKKFGRQYCIYLVRGIDVKSMTYKEIYQINNFNQIINEGKVNLVAINWRVSLSD